MSRSIVTNTVAVVAGLVSVTAAGIAGASSWSPTLLVNTESFQIIDEGDGSTDVRVQFGDSLAQTLDYDRSGNQFRFSDDLLVEGSMEVTGTLSGSQLTLSNLANCNTIDTNSNGQLICGTDEIAGASPLSAVQIRRTSNLSISLNTWTDIPMDATDLENDAATLEHNNTNTDNVDVKADGLYQISYQVTANDTGTTHQHEVRVRVNDSTVVPGSFSVNRNYQNEYGSAVATIVTELTAGDFLTLQVQRTTNNTVINETVLTVVKLDGVAGATGPQGPAGADGADGVQGLRSYFDVYDNAGGQSAASAITLNLDTIRYSHSDYSLSADTVTINADGDYQLLYNISFDSAGARSTTRGWLETDTGGGFSEVDGSRCWTYNRLGGSDGYNSCGRTVILSLSATDQIRVRALAEDGQANQALADGGSLTIKRLN